MQIQNVTPQQLKLWIASNEAVVFDVREPAEFATGHIQHSTLLPVGTINESDLPNTDKKIVIYCQKGARGNAACVKVTENNNERIVYNLEGGIAAWQAEGLPVSTGTA